MKIRLITIPNLLTLSNLLCGCFAAVSALAFDNVTAAFWLIIAAAGFDFLDGFAARLLKQQSPLGIQLDSLADDVTFGMAPAAILFSLYTSSTEAWWLPEEAWLPYLVFLYSACAVLRLAKFNIDDTQRTEFCGLPSPAAALFCASVALLTDRYGISLQRELILAAALVMGLLMLLPIRMFALKFHGFGWRDNALRYTFLAAAAVIVVVLRYWSIPAIIALYVVLSLIRTLTTRAND